MSAESTLGLREVDSDERRRTDAEGDGWRRTETGMEGDERDGWRRKEIHWDVWRRTEMDGDT